MRLSLSDFKKITLGAQHISESCGKITFHRFTEEEELFYKERDKIRGSSFYDRCLATAGIRLSFKTDSKSLKLSADVAKTTSRNYFSFDVYENGKLIGGLDNFKEEELCGNFTEILLPLGSFEKSFSLSEKLSEVCIYFPWSVRIETLSVELDDGALIEPIKPSKKLLAYGDSITQGYDAIRPSQRYAARLANFLGAEEINKAIGGEVFVPGLAKIKADFSPDYITVAYGTNDWSTTDGLDFFENALSFFKTLSEYYKSSKIFAITPIWRANFEEKKPFGEFFTVEEKIKEATRNLKNVTVISGFELVGHDEKLFADLRLHPRDEGFNEYYENLSRKIGEFI